MLEFFRSLTIEDVKTLWVFFFGAFAVLGIFFSMVKAHYDGSFKFNLLDYVVDPTTGRGSGSKTRLNTAFVVSSWVLCYLTVKVNVIDGSFMALFTAYLGAWVTDRALSRTKFGGESDDDGENKTLIKPGGVNKVQINK